MAIQGHMFWDQGLCTPISNAGLISEVSKIQTAKTLKTAVGDDPTV